MRYKVRVLKPARDDLKEIHEYLSEFGESPPRKFREGFKKFSDEISDMPHMLSLYEHNPVYRKAVIVFEYLVFDS